MRTVRILMWAVALLAAPCMALAQTTWTWQGSCPTQGWYDTCAVGSCGPINQDTLFRNNWGQERCGGLPAFPGPNDTAIIPSGFTARISGNVSVARIVVQSGARLIWESGNLSVGVLENYGTLVWKSGYLSAGVLENYGTLEWANDGVQEFRGTVVNRGVWRKTTAAEVRLVNATLRNEANGTLQLERGVIRYWSGSATLQNNGGVIQKVSSDTATLSGVTITGSGRVQVQEGSLQWQDCTLSGATVQVEQGTLGWNGGVAGNSQIGAGAGVVQVNGGVGFASGATLTIASGGQVVWVSGGWSNAQVVNEGVLEWANGSNYWEFNGTVVNRGVLLKTTAATVWLHGTLINEANGVLELQRGTIARLSSSYAATLRNDGRLTKVSPDPNNPTTCSLGDFPITNRGRIEVINGTLNLTTLTQSDGETRFHRNATLNLTNPLNLQGGKLTGAGQLNGTVAHSTGVATFAAGIDEPDQSDLNPLGILTVDGNLTLGNEAVFEVELAGTDNSDAANPQYDQLVVVGASGRTVQLNGTLRVKGRDGFVPLSGNAFDIVVRSGSSWNRTGTFHTVEVDPATLPCVGFEVRYLSNGVRLVAQTLGGPDVNRDGCVDDADLLAVLFAFGQTGGGMAEDANCDGIVDDADLLTVLFNFGDGC